LDSAGTSDEVLFSVFGEWIGKEVVAVISGFTLIIEWVTPVVRTSSALLQRLVQAGLGDTSVLDQGVGVDAPFSSCHSGSMGFQLLVGTR